MTSQPVFQLKQKIAVIREVLGYNKSELANFIGVAPSTLSTCIQQCPPDGSGPISNKLMEKLSEATKFDLRHVSWIDQSIDEKNRYKTHFRRQDTAGHFADYFSPLHGGSVRKYSHIAEINDQYAPDPEVASIVLDNNRQGSVAVEPYRIGGEWKMAPCYLEDGLVFGFSEIQLALRPDHKSKEKMIFLTRLGDGISDLPKFEDSKLSKPSQTGGAQWRQVANEGTFLDGEYHIDPETPLATLDIREAPAGIFLELKAKIYNGTLVDRQGNEPETTGVQNKVLAKLLGDSFFEDNAPANGLILLACHFATITN